ncbi:MAG: tetratricopeptide repeat protein [Pirellulales bacterium]
MSSTRAQLAQVRQLAAAKRIPDALALCRRLTDAEPKSAELWNERGILELKTADAVSAEQSFQRASKIAPHVAQYHHHWASAAQRLGKFELAETHFQRATELSPQQVESRVRWAELLMRRGALAEAEREFRRATVDQPAGPHGWVGLGLVLHRQNRPHEALAAYEQARKLAPDQPELYLNLGTSHRSLGDLDAAVRCYQKAIELRPTYAKARGNLGMIYAARKQWIEALGEFSLAVQHDPRYAEGHDERAKVLASLGRSDEAIASYEAALQVDPGFVNSQVNYGSYLEELGRHDDALKLLEKARADRPDLPEAHNNLGNVYKSLGRLDEAHASYQRAIELRPSYAKARYNLGSVLLEWGRWEEAFTAYDEAARLAVDYAEPRFERGVVRLLQGDFERGWEDYESRWEMRNGQKNRRRYRQPVWNGEPLAGRTLLIYTEQGFGDTFQCIRFASLAKERGGRVVVECQPKLIPLLRSCAGIDQLIPRGEPLPEFDCHVALMSLPRALGVRPDFVPGAPPYLAADPELVESWRQRLADIPGFRIGIAWQGSVTYLRDRTRSLPLTAFRPLAETPGVTLVSLQFGKGAEQVQDPQLGFRVATLPDDVDSTAGAFMDTSAIVKNLDLVIAVDTSINHLCGALGAPAWVLLHYSPDWRWMLEREDSPWYPSVRLFRQRRYNDWDELLQRTAGELANLVSSKKAAKNLE